MAIGNTFETHVLLMSAFPPKAMDPTGFGQRNTEITPPARREDHLHHSGPMERKYGLIALCPAPKIDLGLRQKASKPTSSTPPGHVKRTRWPCAGLGRSALERLQARSGPAPAGQRRRLASPLAHVRGAKWPHCVSCPDRSTFCSLLSPSRLSCSDVPFFMRSPPSSPGAINHRSGSVWTLAGLDS